MSIYLKEGKITTDIQQDDAKVADIVRSTIKEIEDKGDKAIRELSEKFDNWSPKSFQLTKKRDRRNLRINS